jgi:cytochrome c biogenesis protein
MAVDNTAGLALADAPDTQPAVSVGDFCRRLYQVTYSKTIGLFIILAFAVLVLVGVVVAQAPASTWGDPAARQQFLEGVRGTYGGWTALLSLLGACHVFTSIGFYVVVVALAISITGCTTHRIPQLWARWRHPKTHVSQRFYDAARYRATLTTTTSAPAGLDEMAALLRAKHWRVIRASGSQAYADRFGWGNFGTVAAHLAFIVILAAFLVSGLGGYQQIHDLAVGAEPTPIGQGTALALRATDFEATFDDAGRPLDYVSHLVLTEAGQVVAEQDVRVNSPLVWGKWTFHQDSFGLAVEVAVTTAAGQTLFAGPVEQPWASADSTLSIGRFRIEERGLTIQVMTAASGATSATLAAGQAGFVVYRDGEDQAQAMFVVDQGATQTDGDLEFGFRRESQYTGIKARTDPGAIWLWIGGVLLVGGMTVTFTCRHRRLWLAAGDHQIQLASADQEDSSFRQGFDVLVDQARAHFTPRSTP